METELTRQLVNRSPSTHIIRNTLSILDWSSLVIALALGVILAAVIVISQGLHSCYGVVPGPPDFVCPPENRLYYLPILPIGIFFTSLIFGMISLFRWLLANQRIKKASEHE